MPFSVCRPKCPRKRRKLPDFESSGASGRKQMNPIRRELLNGVFVLVVASLMSAAFAAFQLSLNVQL